MLDFTNSRKDGRVAKGACLENMWGDPRGFESHSFRQSILEIVCYNAV